MTTIATADLHLSSNPRDAYRWIFLEETLPALVEEHRAKRVLLLGDLTDIKDGHSSVLVNRLVDGLARLSESVSIYALKGNHDYLAEDTPFFQFLQHLPRMRWINEPAGFRLRGLGDCLFLPHTRAPHSISSLIDRYYDWIFMHQTVDGASGGSRQLAGWKHCFSPCARVISGDVHVPQKLGPVTYIGAPYAVDFGDAFAPRVLLLEGNKMRSIPVPGPQKRLVEVPRRSAPGQRLNPGDVVKVRVELPPGSEQSRADLRAKYREWAERMKVQLHSIEIIAPKAAPQRAPRHRASDADLVRAYARKMKQGKAVEAAGLKLMEQA